VNTSAGVEVMSLFDGDVLQLTLPMCCQSTLLGNCSVMDIILYCIALFVFVWTVTLIAR